MSSRCLGGYFGTAFLAISQKKPSHQTRLFLAPGPARRDGFLLDEAPPQRGAHQEPKKAASTSKPVRANA